MEVQLKSTIPGRMKEARRKRKVVPKQLVCLLIGTFQKQLSVLLLLLLLLVYSEAVLEPHGLLVSYDICSPSSDGSQQSLTVVGLSLTGKI